MTRQANGAAGLGSRAATPPTSKAQCSTPTREQAFDAFCTVLAYVAGQRSQSAADPALTVDKIAATYADTGITERVVADAMRAGALESYRVGRKPVARRSAVERWIESRRVQPRRKAPANDTSPEAAYAALAKGGR